MSHTQGNDLAASDRNANTASSESAHPIPPPNTGDTDIDEILWQFATHMKRAMGGRQVGGEELNHDQAKAAIEQKLTDARISELKQLEPPEQYEGYAKLLGTEHCTICGFNAVEFRRHIQDRITALQANKDEK